MKKLRRGIALSLVFIFFEIILCPVYEVNAAWGTNSANVQAKMQEVCDPLKGKSFSPFYYYYNGKYKGEGCQAFVMQIADRVFACSYFSNSSKWKRSNAQQDYNNLGNYLKNNARPGDILRFDGEDQLKAHSVILYSIDSNSISYYETDSKSETNNIVHKKVNTYAELRDRFSSTCKDYFIYQASDDIYNAVKGSTAINKAPEISDIKIDNLTRSGFHISCRATDDNAVYIVRFRIYTKYNGKDDVREYTAELDSNGRYTAYISTANHNNESGEYAVETYAWDYDDVCAGREPDQPVIVPDNDPPTVSDVKIENLSSAGFKVSCKASDDKGIYIVRFRIYTKYNGKDDVREYTAELNSNGRYTAYISTANHNNESGEYAVEAYAWDYDDVCAGRELDQPVIVPQKQQKKSIASVTVSGISNKTYTGKAITQALTVTLEDKALQSGTDYTISYANNVNAGTATLTITGTGSYTGSLKKTFAIAKANQTITAYDVTKTTANTVFSLGAKTSGKGQLSYKSGNTKIVTVDSAGKVTIKGAGKATITITASATGNYNQATKTINVTVTAPAKKSLAKALISGIIVKTYTGKNLTQKLTVKLGSRTLKAGTDYTVSYKNNKNAGTATITITGKGNYKDTTTATFKIKKSSNSFSVKAIKTTCNIKYSNLAKKDLSIKQTQIYNITKKGQGNISYTLSSAKNGKTNVKSSFAIDRKTGMLTVKRGLKKGTYSVTIKVTDAGDNNYIKTEKKLTISVKVK